MFGNKVGHLGRVGSLTLAQRVSAMFSRGEPGAWYDPSDMSTLFQDSAGTVPVTAVEQPVGRILDKSGRGNHATQATTTKRPVLSRRVNLLTKTEDFSDAIWAKNSGTTVSGRKIISGTGYGYQGIQHSIAVAAGSEYITKCKVKAAEYTRVTISDGAFSRFAFTFDLTSGVITESRGVDYASATITSAGSGEFVITLRSTFAQAIYYTRFSGNPGNTAYAAGAYFTGDGVSGVEVWDVSVTLATDAHLPYQWVNTDTDYDADPAKFPAYLRFDGVDDALQTGNIDFTSTDKMTVWAGVTKLSDAATAVLLESSVNTNSNYGAFYITAPETPGTDGLSFRSLGSLATSQVDLFGNAAPISRVVAAIGDIGGDISTIRAGGASNTSAQDQGTGNYGNYPLYVGARAGTSFFFNGRLYSLIVRGAQSSLSQVEATELYTKQKMRLP